MMVDRSFLVFMQHSFRDKSEHQNELLYPQGTPLWNIQSHVYVLQLNLCLFYPLLHYGYYLWIYLSRIAKTPTYYSLKGTVMYFDFVRHSKFCLLGVRCLRQKLICTKNSGLTTKVQKSIAKCGNVNTS